jgi:hypothetical protein
MRTCALSLVFALLVAQVHAEPLPGETLAFRQQPLDQTQIMGQTYQGHSELSTATVLPIPGALTVYGGRFAADDFAVKSADPITHVRWWGTYLNTPALESVQRFLITFERDVPSGPGQPFSRPGEPIVSQVVRRGMLSAGSGTFTEDPDLPVPPSGDTPLAYDAALATPFSPEPNTVYWLKVTALADLPLPGTFEPRFMWGWQVRDYIQENSFAPAAPTVVPGEFVTLSPIPELPAVWHFQDAAVVGNLELTDRLTSFLIAQRDLAPRNYLEGVDGPDLLVFSPQDLAFELYSIPEPSAVMLAAGAALPLVFLFDRGRRRFRL